MDIPLILFLGVALIILIIFFVGALLNIQTVLRFRSIEPRVGVVVTLFWVAAAAVIVLGSIYFLSVDWSQTFSASSASINLPSVQIQQ